jgi:hypothetical protein
MDTVIRHSRHHYKRQRPAIHLFVVGQPVSAPLHQTHSDERLPPAIQRPRGGVSPPSEGCSPSQSGWGRLVLTHPSGIVGFQVSLEGGLRFFPFRGCFWFTVGLARAVSFCTRVAVSVVHQGFSRRPGWPLPHSDSSPHHAIAHIPSRGSPVGSLCAGLPRRRPAAAVAAL